MRRSDRAVGILPPSVPSLPNLSAEVGKLHPAPLLGVPNLPNLPSLAPRVCAPVRVRGRGGAHTPPRVHACAQDEKGWEGWEGWEQAVNSRLLASQPRF